MASVVISSRSGPHGGGADQTYYCFDCDRRLTIIATSDTGIICPICGHVVLEEFETPSSPPSPPPRPPPRPNAFIDPESFFPTSDTDSDVELYDPLPPPPPPLSVFFTTPNTTSTSGQTMVNSAVDRLSQLHIHPPTRLPQSSSRNFWDFHHTFDSEVRHIRPPSSPPPPPPLPPVTDQRPPCPQFPVPSTTTMNYFYLPPSDRNYSSQYDNELDELRLPIEHLVLSPPLTPSRSSDASEFFYSPSRDPEEETPNQPPSPPPQSISNPWDYIFPGIPEQQSNSPNHDSSSDLQPPPPPPSPPPSISNPWDYIFPGIPEQQSNSPNHDSSSDLQPPPPPPWLMLFPMEDLSDMKMTEELVLDWESHQCSICIENFELNQMVRLTPCNHLYHTDCLSRWLDLHKSCPICRCKLSSR